MHAKPEERFAPLPKSTYDAHTAERLRRVRRLAANRRHKPR